MGSDIVRGTTGTNAGDDTVFGEIVMTRSQATQAMTRFMVEATVA